MKETSHLLISPLLALLTACVPIESIATPEDGAADAGTVDSLDGTAAIIESYRIDPLWSTLKVVQNNDFYPSPIYWQSNGFVSVHAVLDDMFTYFAEPVFERAVKR